MSGVLPAGLLQLLAIDGPDAIIYADRGQDPVLEPVGNANLRLWRVRGTRKNLDLIVPEPQRVRHWEGYHRLRAVAASRYGEGEVLAVPVMRKDGKRISIEFTILPARQDTGVMVEIAAFLRDVTTRLNELRALRQELGVLKAQSSRE